MKNSIIKLNAKEVKNVSGGGGLIFIGFILTGIGAYIYRRYAIRNEKKTN